MIALIAAYAKNRVIGNQGKMVWHIKGEQQRFKELTTGNVIIVGRRTFEETGTPLPNRFTIVVSKTRNFTAPNCQTVTCLEDALQLAGERNVFISGGQRLYEQGLAFADIMYLTEIEKEFIGDTYFPSFDEGLFHKEVNQMIEGVIPYRYVTYTRKKNL